MNILQLLNYLDIWTLSQMCHFQAEVYLLQAIVRWPLKKSSSSSSLETKNVDDSQYKESICDKVVIRKTPKPW